MGWAVEVPDGDHHIFCAQLLRLLQEQGSGDKVHRQHPEHPAVHGEPAPVSAAQFPGPVRLVDPLPGGEGDRDVLPRDQAQQEIQQRRVALRVRQQEAANLEFHRRQQEEHLIEYVTHET